MSDFADLFADFMPDILIAQPVTTDAYGDMSSVGSPLTIRCRIEGANRKVRGSDGNEVVSSVQVITQGAFNLTTDKHRYTLPSRFSPNTNLKAVAVSREGDEDGPVYEEVMFP